MFCEKMFLFFVGFGTRGPTLGEILYTLAEIIEINIVLKSEITLLQTKFL